MSHAACLPLPYLVQAVDDEQLLLVIQQHVVGLPPPLERGGKPFVKVVAAVEDLAEAVGRGDAASG